MGFVYLSVFIGAMAYKFNYFVGDLQDRTAIILLVLVILAIIVLVIRRILREA